ncbi:MAG: bifunctional anthranilate synthase component I family protein/class IV aminotransferase [Candidatus Goldbacteria bacterium]|nr:bifunctional anthranilate synthase component I family protein/class IV aminotransferase [Candidatus Goldiibacteriota bacterium]
MKNFLNILKEKDNYILFYSQKQDNGESRILFFSNPINVVECKRFKDIKDKLSLLDSFVEKKYFLAGFISYEQGYFFNDLKYNSHLSLPFFYFGIYENMEEIKKENIIINDDFVVFDLKNNITFNKYRDNIKKIKHLIKNGEVYQVNYCFKEKFRFSGSAESLFFKLCENQKTKYSFLVKNKNYYILSISPEMFFHIKDKDITMKPMKGTLLKSSVGDLNELKNEKNQAENIMIVDLIRNDLGKICEVNSISVPKKFTIEEYETIYQMTSTIKGKLKEKISFSDIFTALFPSGSVTGAPKRRAMQIIKLLEKEARGVYTGSIGYFSKNEALFNIAIRTPVINRKKNTGEMGIGSGIVFDSDAEKEFKECLGKARFFNSLVTDFKIFESILYKKGKGVFLLDEHLDRMETACMYFGFKFNKIKVLEEVVKVTKKIKDFDEYKIRIFVDLHGNVTTDTEKIIKKQKILKIMISDENVNSDNIFLRYKTTKREFYDRKLKEAKEKGFDEVVFFNEKGQLTECATSNIFILKDGVMYTPPVYCGLLDGALRRTLLITQPQKYKEKILYKEDLINADKIFICNSVRGIKECKI